MSRPLRRWGFLVNTARHSSRQLSLMRRRLLLLLRLGIGLGLLVWALRRAEWSATSQLSLAQIHPGWMSLAVLLGGASLLGWALRWYVFLRLYRLEVSLAETAKLTLYADFFNFYFLGPLGADGLRLLLLGRRFPQQRAQIAGAIFLDHACGLLAVGVWYVCFTRPHLDWLMTTAGGAWSGAIVTSTNWAIGVSCVLTFIGVGMVIEPAVRRHLWRRVGQERYLKWSDQFCPVRPRKGLVILGQAISILVIATFYSAWWAAARAVGNPLPADRLLASLPIVDFISGMPISVSGVGVRENLFVELLGRQLGAGRAVEISLLGFAAVGLWGLIGGVALAFHQYKSRSPLVVDSRS